MYDDVLKVYNKNNTTEMHFQGLLTQQKCPAIRYTHVLWEPVLDSLFEFGAWE